MYRYNTGSVTNLDASGLRDTWVAKIGPSSSGGSAAFGVAWIKALGGSSAESTTAIVHDAANGGAVHVDSRFLFQLQLQLFKFLANP